MEEKEKVVLRYKITEEDYIEFNQIVFKNDTVSKRKKSYVMGTVLIILSIILGIQAIITGRYKEYWLDVAIIYSFFCGIYNLMAFRSIYPKRLAKQARKMYNNTKWPSSEVTVEVTQTELVYKSEDEWFSGKFTDIKDVYEGTNIIIVVFHGKQWHMLINKEVIGADLMKKIISFRKENKEAQS